MPAALLTTWLARAIDLALLVAAGVTAARFRSRLALVVLLLAVDPWWGRGTRLLSPWAFVPAGAPAPLLAGLTQAPFWVALIVGLLPLLSVSPPPGPGTSGVGRR